MNESYDITLEEIDKTIIDLESQIDFENKFNKLVSSESFNEVFYNVIFGTELLALTVRLADDKSDEAELETIEEIKRELLPLVTLITPNLDEASVLTDKSIHNIHEMQEAAKRLVDEYQTSVLIKGGHLEGDRMCDLLHTSESIFHIYEEKKR